jgi:hypothetical protein
MQYNAIRFNDFVFRICTDISKRDDLCKLVIIFRGPLYG